MTAPQTAERPGAAASAEQGYWWWLREPPAPPETRFQGFTREQVEGKWPAHLRAMFLIAASLGAWTVLLAGLVAFLRHVVPALGL